jgi:hypothetical protein
MQKSTGICVEKRRERPEEKNLNFFAFKNKRFFLVFNITEKEGTKKLFIIAFLLMRRPASAVFACICLQKSFRNSCNAE